MPTVEEVAIKIEVADHIGLAHAVASHFVDPKQVVKDSDEYAEACLALVKAAKEYTQDHGPFAPYAWKVMKNRLITFMRHKRRRKRMAQFDLDCKLEGVETPVQEIPIPAEVLDKLLVDMPNENKGDKVLLVEVYLCGTKVQEIAERMGVSRPTIYNRLHRAIERIRSNHPDLLEQYEGVVK